MELNFSLIAIAIFVILMLIMFAKVNISYQPGEGNTHKPTMKTHLLNSRKNTDKTVSQDKMDSVMKNNDNQPGYSAYGLPEKDAYMSKGFRDQIDSLRSKLYYDNCKYNLLEEFDTVPTCSHPLFNIKETST